MRKKYTLDEVLTMSQHDLFRIYEQEEKLLTEGIITESSLSVSFGNMTLDEISNKYGLHEWEDVKNEIMGKLGRNDTNR